MAQLIVTGAAGQMGRLVLGYLLDTYRVPASRIIAVTRSPDKLNDFKEKGVIVRFGDFNDAASLKEAFKGGDRLLAIPTDTMGPARLVQFENLLREVVNAGVKHIVYVSAVTPPAGAPPVFPDIPVMEEKVKSLTGVTYSIVGYDLWSESLMQIYAGALASGTLYTSSADGKAAHITREDFSRASAAALASDITTNAKYEVTGPEVLTRKQVVDAINQVLGLSIKIVEVAGESEVAEKLGVSMQNLDFAKFLAQFDSRFRDGTYSKVGDGYYKLTGQQPEKFVDFLKRTKSQYQSKK